MTEQETFTSDHEEEEVFPTRKPQSRDTSSDKAGQMNELVGVLLKNINDLMTDLKDDPMNDDPKEEIELRNMGYCFKAVVSSVCYNLLWLLIKLDGAGYQANMRVISINMFLKSYLKDMIGSIKSGYFDAFFDYPDKRLSQTSTILHEILDFGFGTIRFVFDHKYYFVGLACGYVGYALSEYLNSEHKSI